MEYRKLGNTGLEVSRICFGSLTLGPLQANLSIVDGSNVIISAIDRGINFIDTAELYETYPYIKDALKKTTKDVVIASRSYAYSKEMAQNSIEKARCELDRDVIEIFGLHEQETQYTLRGHREAIEYFAQSKSKGIIKAVLITTHCIEAVRFAADMPEIDVIHPIVNMSGFGIKDGTLEEMLYAIEYAHQKGKGIYSMKALGGGNLLGNYTECLDFVITNKNIDSVAIGMKTVKELDINLKYFEGNKNVNNLLNESCSKKELFIQQWCEKCGVCIKRCPQGALSFLNEKVVVDKSKCILCGYCGSACPSSQIRII